jgi:hypothetical protein
MGLRSRRVDLGDMLQGNLQPGFGPAGEAADESQEAVIALDVDDEGGGGDLDLSHGRLGCRVGSSLRE